MSKIAKGKTPGGVQLLIMSSPRGVSKRNLFSAAAQLTFENLQNMTTTPIADAIAAQQKSRTPVQKTLDSIVEAEHEALAGVAKNRLNNQQQYALDAYIEQYKLTLVGKTLIEAAEQFNADIAKTHPAFTTGEVSRTVTFSNVYGAMRRFGLGVSNYKICATDPNIFTSLAPAVAEPNPNVDPEPLPFGFTEVRMFRGPDGRMYESIEAALEAGKIDELAQFIYAVQDNHDEASAKDLARKLLNAYEITPYDIRP